MWAFRASVRDQLDLMSLSDGVGEFKAESEDVDPTGIPRVYHEPETDKEEEALVVSPSAARLPGMGMLGIDVRIVLLAESYTRSYIGFPVCGEVSVEERLLFSPIALAIRSATLAGSVLRSSGL